VRTITWVVEFCVGFGLDIDATQVCALAGGADRVARRVGDTLVAVAVMRGLDGRAVCALEVAAGVADVGPTLALVDVDSTAELVLRLDWVLLQAAIGARVIMASAAARLLRLSLHTRPRYLQVTVGTAGGTPPTCRAGPAWTPWKTDSPFSSPHG
jgi:hypothetical protein